MLGVAARAPFAIWDAILFVADAVTVGPSLLQFLVHVHPICKRSSLHNFRIDDDGCVATCRARFNGILSVLSPERLSLGHIGR
jgi:hypothetical protein